MLIRLDEAGFNSRLGTLRRAQTFTLEHLVTIHSTSCDLRWALAELAVRSIAAMLELGRKRLVPASCPKGPSGKPFSPADTTVAAGGG
jgi:hypothetical protein